MEEHASEPSLPTDFDEQVNEQCCVIRQAYHTYRGTLSKPRLLTKKDYEEYAMWLETNFAIMRVLINQSKQNRNGKA